MARIAVAQLNPRIGDFQGNLEKITQAVRKARRARATSVIFSEMATSGYPPRDLVLRREFLQANTDCLEKIALLSRDMPIVIGSIFPSVFSPRGRGAVAAPKGEETSPLRHGALLFKGGKYIASQAKTYLPNGDVFNESRHFSPARDYALFPLAPRLKAAVTICEDMWNVDTVDPFGMIYKPYPSDVFRRLVALGPQWLVNLNASPYWRGKFCARVARARELACRFHLPFLYVNAVGANDELVFDGRSFAVDASGECVWQMRAFEEELGIFDTEMRKTSQTSRRRGAVSAPNPAVLPVVLVEHEEIVQAITLGIRDYVKKSGFARVILGLSGGIDSALVAALAVRALGSENVLALWLPSPYSSRESKEDAFAVATHLGIECRTLEIHSLMQAGETLVASWREESSAWALARENIQARLRGTVLMAFANAENRLLLTTGNKSELAVGYCTLYGDMCGALNPIGDVYKTEVYGIARHLNCGKNIFSERLLTKAPSAELRPDQKDEDSLPPYTVLDSLIREYMEEGKTPDQLIAMGIDAKVVSWFVTAFHRAEYKRRQAAPILKLRSRSFGMGWQYPLAKGVDFS